jgi:undecaprenyl-diphosphatase
MLTVSWYWASGGNVPDPEVEVFRWLNDSLPDGLEWVLWGPMQFGAIGAVVAVALGQLVLTRRWLPTLMTVVVGLEAWALAKVIKPIVDRGRPGVEIDEVIHRGGSIGGGIDAGRGFVSGHAAIAAGLAVALTVVLPARWRWVPWLLALIVGIGRNYFGAHLPLDIVGGYGLGLLLAGATLVATGRIVDRSSEG